MVLAQHVDIGPVGLAQVEAQDDATKQRSGFRQSVRFVYTETGLRLPPRIATLN
jgi:hypothetical protein